MADDEQQRSAYAASTPAQWSPHPHIYPHSHHGTPAQEYSGFSFGGPPAVIDNGAFAANTQRTIHSQLQPLVMPQWPSMLNSQQATYQPMYPAATQSLQSMPISTIPTPVSASSSRSLSTPRKTLTDHDRKRMCQYAEEHPNSKQTEIGAIFGVERSTVSKVLRQKEKYLLQDDGSRSPVKRAKGRSPDIERALAIWAKNQEKKGLPLSDDLIREKARAFAATTATPENHVAMSASWIEKFKLKNNLMGARSRKSSLAPDDTDNVAGIFGASSAAGTSPSSPVPAPSTSPVELQGAASHENLRNESPDGYIDFPGRLPFHSQSTTSLNSAFTDTAPSSFSPGPLSPSSSFFTPDSGVAPGPFLATARPGLSINAASNSQRPRSQTFPLLDQYFLASSGEALTPKYTTTHLLDSPMEEASDPVASVNEILHVSQYQNAMDSRPQTVTPADTMGPPPLPANLAAYDRRRSLTPATSITSTLASTSPEEARHALQVVLNFFEQQPKGFLDLQESVTLGKLMEKLKLP
ncbi:hypothetical protein AMS68_001570 [Peltaster fructicola]|uniref:HTH CENPB-type domain-containing protein n=1 Tax=Peltaster fructicola TaxID=286661 RepID=A0A6H0XMV5_9PEZI|nr:hypothetical protein AMS68_001570 [Peltaster fructicola]